MPSILEKMSFPEALYSLSRANARGWKGFSQQKCIET